MSGGASFWAGWIAGLLSAAIPVAHHYRRRIAELERRSERLRFDRDQLRRNRRRTAR